MAGGSIAAAWDGVCGRPVVRSGCECAPVVVCPPCPCAPRPTPLATPTPAPPSTAEPPMAAPPPTAPAPMPPVTLNAQASPSHDVYRVPARTPSERPGARARVSFWNLSGRDRVLKVGGKTQTLPSGRRVILEVERSFEWAVDGAAAETATVKPGDRGLEVVLRR